MILSPKDCAALAPILHNNLDRLQKLTGRDVPQLRGLADDLLLSALTENAGDDVMAYFEAKLVRCSDPAAREWLGRFLGNVRKAITL